MPRRVRPGLGGMPSMAQLASRMRALVQQLRNDSFRCLSGTCVCVTWIQSPRRNVQLFSFCLRGGGVSFQTMIAVAAAGWQTSWGFATVSSPERTSPSPAASQIKSESSSVVANLHKRVHWLPPEHDFPDRSPAAHTSVSLLTVRLCGKLCSHGARVRCGFSGMLGSQLQ